MAAIHNMFDVNVFGVVEVIRAFLPLLRAHGPGARIINMGSVAGWGSSAIHAVYSGTKHAVRAILDGLRIEMLPFGIAVVSVCVCFSFFAWGRGWDMWHAGRRARGRPLELC
jgi:NADP-dependent 3-hydroxy acid dehydrogenase YdfG